MFRYRIICCSLSVLVFWVAPKATTLGQELHVLKVCDTSDWARWGKFRPNIQMDSVNAFAMFFNNVPENQLDMISITLEENDSPPPAEILKTIDDFQIAPADTLVFYYSGHGGADDRGHYLVMAKGKIYREDLRRHMLAKGPRLTVILTDCCNVRSDGRAFMAPAVRLVPPHDVTPIFDSLFFKPRGVVDINSSAPNESAFFFAARDKHGMYQGSLFSGLLTRYIRQAVARRISWDTLVRDIGLAVGVEFRKNYPQGASIAKGAVRQRQQNVYAISYPGMPERKGPRTGLTVRDFAGGGVLIVGVVEDSPSQRVYDVKADRYVALNRGGIIYSANGKPVRNVKELAAVVKASPRIMRLGIGRLGSHQTDYLIRLRY